MFRKRHMLGSLLLLFSALANAEDIKDVKSPVDFPPNLFWLYFMIFILLFFGIYFFVKYIRGKRIPFTTPVILKLPWEKALEDIERLEKSGLIQRNEFKEFYTRLSAVIRTYFEERFNIRAPEMTTEEFLWSLKNHRVLDKSQEDILKQFLTSSDLIKFADQSPKIAESENSLRLVRQLVEDTKRVVVASSV